MYERFGRIPHDVTDLLLRINLQQMLEYAKKRRCLRCAGHLQEGKNTIAC